MSSTGITILMFQCVFEGSLSMQDTEIERRPYHKNCSCALHSKASICSNACQRNISFPKKQSGNGSSLRIRVSATSKFSSPLVGDMSTNTGNRENSNGVRNSTLPYRR